MSITVIKPGILDTIQDLGRFGYQQLGINPGGAMDRFSMRVANVLVGNEASEPVLEMHFPAPVLLFNTPMLIALSGADLSARINGEPLPLNHPVLVVKNDMLHFQQPQEGARVYLAVAGGYVTDKWMNSSSTHLKAGAGGYKGRPLKKEDLIEIKEADRVAGNHSRFVVLPWEADTLAAGKRKEIRVLPGHEWDSLRMEAKDNFFGEEFVISHQSDRMGYRLSNLSLQRNTTEELVSSAVGYGTVQLLPDGGLIILMADHQTTGGYPRLAHMIKADHPKLAQLKAGERIRFCITTQREAEEAYLKQEQHLLQLRIACIFRLQEYFEK